MATRAVAVRRPSRRYFPRRRYHSRAGFTIPLAVVAGLIPTFQVTYQGYQQGGISAAFNQLTYNLTGYNPANKYWDLMSLVRGWTPIIAGFAVHKLAGYIGINRTLARARVPFIRI